jgi:hypothetical protein
LHDHLKEVGEILIVTKDSNLYYQGLTADCWEEHRLRVFENRVLRRIFGRKRDEVTGEWRRLHNEELNDLY